MTSEDALIDVAERSADGLEDDDAKGLILHALRTHSRELIDCMSDGDKPKLLLPVAFYIGAGRAPGCILALQDRAVLAWKKGLLRPKRYTEVVAYDEVRKVDHALGSSTYATLTIEAGKTWEMRCPDLPAHSKKPYYRLVKLLSGDEGSNSAHAG